MPVGQPEIHFVERRDLAARADRDRLADLLGIPAGELGIISREQAEAMAQAILRVKRKES